MLPEPGEATERRPTSPPPPPPQSPGAQPRPGALDPAAVTSGAVGSASAAGPSSGTGPSMGLGSGWVPEVVAQAWRAITPLGRSVAVLGLASWFVASRTGWAELAVLACACLLALLIGIVMLFVGGTDLVVALELGAKRVVEGQPAASRVETTNPLERRSLPVRLEARVGKGTARLSVPGLAAGESHRDLVEIPTKRRSIVPVGPVRSVQGDPLGLVRKEKHYTGTEQLFVHPRTVRVGSLTTGWMRDLEGEETNDRSPSDVAFHALREYVAGDDRRHIHWRTTARQADGALMVREFVDTRRAHLGLLLSLREGDYASPDEFELAVSVLASIGLQGIVEGQDVSGIVGGRILPCNLAPNMLDTLAGVELGDDDLGLAGSAAMARVHMTGASVAAIVTGSQVDMTEVRLATERLGKSVRSVVFTANLGADASMHAGSPATTVRIGTLEDLPRMLAAATR